MAKILLSDQRRTMPRGGLHTGRGADAVIRPVLAVRAELPIAEGGFA